MVNNNFWRLHVNKQQPKNTITITFLKMIYHKVAPRIQISLSSYCKHHNIRTWKKTFFAFLIYSHTALKQIFLNVYAIHIFYFLWTNFENIKEKRNFFSISNRSLLIPLWNKIGTASHSKWKRGNVQFDSFYVLDLFFCEKMHNTFLTPWKHAS